MRLLPLRTAQVEIDFAHEIGSGIEHRTHARQSAGRRQRPRRQSHRRLRTADRDGYQVDRIGYVGKVARGVGGAQLRRDSLWRDRCDSCRRIQRLQQVIARTAGPHQHVNSLTRTQGVRRARGDDHHIGNRDAIVGDDVQIVPLQNHQDRLARGRIEHTPALHLARAHVQHRVCGSVGGVIGITSEVGAPQSVRQLRRR